jgi:hypothetical protein
VSSTPMATFSRQISSPKPRVEVLGAALNSFSKPMRGMGYKLESQSHPTNLATRLGVTSVSRMRSGK